MDLELLFGSLVLVLTSAATGFAAHRLAPRLLPGARSAADQLLRAALVAALCVVLPVAVLGAAGGLGRASLLLATAALVATAVALGTKDSVKTGGRLGELWPFLPAGLLLVVDAVVFLPRPPTNWDAMTYHLYLPARWLQEGRIFHVPTPWSDESSAFAPQSGALAHAWQMALLGRDTTTNVAQLLALVVLALAVYRLTLLLGADRPTASMTASLAVCLPPLRFWATTGNVDADMLAAFAVALASVAALVSRARASDGEVSEDGAQPNPKGGRRPFEHRPQETSPSEARARDSGTARTTALAAGLAAGTKTLALPLVLPILVVLTAVLAWRRRFGELVLCGGAFVVGGGFWYVANLWRYGNPLFPLDFRLLGVHFAGAFDTAALRTSYFRHEELGAWLESIYRQLGIGPLIVAGLGLGGLAMAIWLRRGDRRGWTSLGLLAFAAFWAWYSFAVVPHNNQARFLAPALLMALLGWGTWFRLLRSSLARGVLFAAGLGLSAWAARPDLAWGFVLDRLAAAEIDVGAWLLTATAGLLVVGALVGIAVGWLGKRRDLSRPVTLLAGGTAAVVATMLLTLGATHAAASRMAFLAAEDYRVWAAGYLMWNDPAMPPRRIAYAGANVPYALMGSGFRHVVVACETRGEPGEGLYEHWSRAGRQVYETHKPGLYRGPDDDEATWRACLERHQIDTVVLFETLPVERPAHWPLSNGFPIERQWMRSRPELYEPVLLTAKTEIYRVLDDP